MKIRTQVLLATSVALFTTAGCGSERDEPSTDVAAQRVQEETSEAIDAAADYFRAQREELESRAERVSQEMGSEIDEARAAIAEMPEQAREEYEASLERAERAREQVTSQIDALQETTASRWDEARRRMSAALDEASEARQEIRRALEGEHS